MYEPALVRVMLAHEVKRRRILCLAIKLGRPGSEERLLEALDGFGDKRMATDFLNAGSNLPAAGATRWADAHNYRIYQTTGLRTVAVWGRF